MKLIPSIFKNKETRKNHHQQQPLQYWPSSCKQQPKTLSFRGVGNDVMFKTVNSVYFDPLAILETVETPESWFTKSSESSACSFSTESEEHVINSATATGEESLEMILRGIRSSERLFFEPGDTSSILKEAKINNKNNNTNDNEGLTFSPLKESVVLAMESEDPYLDFKSSMQEMVETHGLKDWESLEELLGWYLKMNGKKNHGFIVGAFVDLLLGLVSSSSSSSDTENSCSSFLSASSSFSTLSSPLSSSAAAAVQIQKERQQMS